MKLKMSELENFYRGRPAAVLGGGPSLPDDLKRIPKDALLIAVNYHAFKLVQADYMVYNDHLDSDPRLEEAVKNTTAVRVSAGETSDIEFDVDVWTGFYSSNTAAWFALWMGCDPVILCGMDCYQGDRVYFHEYDHDCPTFHYPLEHHLQPWVEDGKHRLPHVERLKAASGPLASIFGTFQSEAL